MAWTDKVRKSGSSGRDENVQKENGALADKIPISSLLGFETKSYNMKAKLEQLARQYISGEITPKYVVDGITPDFSSVGVNDLVTAPSRAIAGGGAMVDREFLLQTVIDGHLTPKGFDYPAQYAAIRAEGRTEDKINQYVAQNVESLIVKAGLASNVKNR